MITFSKKALFVFVFLFNTVLLFATEQISDIILCNGNTLYLSGTQDEDFRLYPILQDERFNSKMKWANKSALQLSSCQPSCCYRGYQAIWELHNGIIYLKEVLDYCTKEPLFDLKKIFGKGFVTEKGVRAYWINGPLFISSKPFNAYTVTDPMKTILLNIKDGRMEKKE
jgi:hypothetical protein